MSEASLVYVQVQQTFCLELRPVGNEVRSKIECIASNWHVENEGRPCDLPHEGDLCAKFTYELNQNQNHELNVLCATHLISNTDELYSWTLLGIRRHVGLLIKSDPRAVYLCADYFRC